MFNSKEFMLCRPALLKTLRGPIAVVFGLLLSACGGGGGGGGGGGAAPLTSVALPETGQTLCHDTAGAVVGCADPAGIGQDGNLLAGVAWPSPRFVGGTGATADCVTDSLTGLMWVRSPGTTTANWANALTSANDLDLCGFTDWRLPNRNELFSLINHSLANNSALNSQGFSNIAGNLYWSSSSVAGNASSAWYIFFGAGHVQTQAKSNNGFVWPVRAGL